MSFYKSHFIFFPQIFFSIVVLSSCMNWRWTSVSFAYFHSISSFSDFYMFSSSWDYVGSSFLMMLLTVCSVISTYSAVYFEHYNNTKMFFLFLSFFLAMVALSISNSFLNFLVGWEGLGLSSICLIMFYPNKNTEFNSTLTMFFNRVGDVSIFFTMGLTFNQLSLIMGSGSGISLIVIFLLLTCASTKSAQIPLNSWLPAAMSAPTPISAMVHSSTLVTAGIFLILKFSGFHYFEGVVNLISLLFMSTFLLGGFLANLELDLKKVVAFSTMSQISMILLFSSLENYLSLALLHMIFHAMFKTLLFLVCGVIFMGVFSDQFKSFCQGTSSILLHFSLFISLYAMTGLIFSSSFFSKDYLLEFLNSESSMFLLFSLVFGSILTLSYCSYVAETLMNFWGPFSWSTWL